MRIIEHKVLLTANTPETHNFPCSGGKVKYISIKAGANDEFDFMYTASLTFSGKEIPIGKGLGGSSNTELIPLDLHIKEDFGLRIRTQNLSAMTMEAVVMYD